MAFTENIFNLLYKYKETRGGKYMIYTVTLNPSIDYVIELDSLNHGSVNRVNEENIYPNSTLMP